MGLKDADACGDGTCLVLDDNGHTFAEALLALVGTVNLRALAAAEGALLLHAGALSVPDGGIAVLCGPSGSGKSTLTATLAARGLAYLTDETVCLAPESLHVTPFRKPLSLKQGSHEVLSRFRPVPGSVAEKCTGPQWLIPPGELGQAELPSEPLLPQVVLLPTYTLGASLEVGRLEPAEAAYLLGGNTSRLRAVHGGGLPALARLVRRTPAYRLVYGDVEAAADAVEHLWSSAA